jgi:dienelactone hydrolase
VITKSVRDGDLVGTFARPEGKGPYAGVLALGGSDGGIPEYLLRLLVPEGFACLALAYFSTPDTQRALVEVPLERVQHGLRWLLAQPTVAARDGRVAVVGASKGAELALLVAATFPDLVGPVVAYTPSAVVWAGVDLSLSSGAAQSSWSVGGRPLPFVPYPTGVAPSIGARGMSLRPIYDKGLDDAAAVRRAAIPIERATGPVLLISGDDDGVWPATRMCTLLTDRMRDAGRSAAIRHLRFAQAGHALFPYPRPPDEAPVSMQVDFGGSDESADAAHQVAWPEVVRHLRSA